MISLSATKRSAVRLLSLTAAAAVLVCGAVLAAQASQLFLDTDYRLRGVNFTNNDYDTSTSSDAWSYYSHRLRLTLTERFDPDTEIGARITSLGIAGSTTTPYAVPFPRTDFTPYIENAYVKLSNLMEQDLSLTAGKQPLEFGDGFVVSDNGTGATGISAAGRWDVPVPFVRFVFPLRAEVFTAKLAENFRSSSDKDISGAVLSVPWGKYLYEISYFDQADRSGTAYTQGALSVPTNAILKRFYDLRVGRKEDISEWQFEIAKENGQITRSDTNESVTINGMGYTLSGKLIGKDTKLGHVTARALIAYSSGDNDPLSFDDDESFSPDLTRKFDGLERVGYGELFAATPIDAQLPIPGGYSGIDTLSLGADISPLYAWTFNATYFLYAASQGPKGAPEASGFERIYGAEFALGIELNLSAKYEYSKNVQMKVSFSRYTPPRSDLWPKNDPATRYLMEIAAKF